MSDPAKGEPEPPFLRRLLNVFTAPRRVRRFVNFITYLYLLRFTVVTLGALVLIWAGAFRLGAKPLLLGLFDLNSYSGIFYLSIGAFTTSWAAMASSRLARFYGDARYKVELFGAPRRMRWYTPVNFGVPAALIMGGVMYVSRLNPWGEFGAAAGGLAVSLALVIFATFWQRAVLPSREAAGAPDLLFPTDRGLLRPLFRKAEETNVRANLAASARRRNYPRVASAIDDPEARAGDAEKGAKKKKSERQGDAGQTKEAAAKGEALSNIGEAARRGAGKGRQGKRADKGFWHGGYVGFDEAGRRFVLPGHYLVTVLFIFTLALYLEFHREPELGSSWESTFPPLLYVMLLLQLFCWGMSAAAFFLDRYRIPVLIPVLGLVLLTSLFPRADHFYHVMTDPAELSRCEALPPAPAAAAPTPRPSIIVVAANGGGIQAAAWTARVLTGLEYASRRAFGDHFREFGKSIRLVSSVSGGSTGAMYFVNEYDEAGELPATGKLQDIVGRASASSLGAVAWGLAYPDFHRIIIPGAKFRLDRGKTLEEAWMLEGSDWPRRGGPCRGLSDWRREVEAGRRPASIFNATITDTGAPLALATCDLKPASPDSLLNLKEAGVVKPVVWTVEDLFAREGGHRDIAVVTAARLSATFPYVSPPARADLGGHQYHVVDGGYYDNYGISSLVAWLDNELRRPVPEGGVPVKNVLVIRIHGAPTAPKSNPDDSHGWVYETLAPLSTLLNVRTAGQYSHSAVELELLRRDWEGAVNIKPLTFEFPGENSPLSWHLTADEKCEIENKWREVFRTQWPHVAGFLAGVAGRGEAPPFDDNLLPPRDPRCTSDGLGR